MECIITLKFNFDNEGSDSRGDADWLSLNYIKEHIMDDEDTNPIEIINLIYKAWMEVEPINEKEFNSKA